MNRHISAHKIDWNGLARDVVSYRRSLGLSQRDFCKSIGVSINTISRIESGFGNTNVELYLRLAHAIRANIQNYFLGARVQDGHTGFAVGASVIQVAARPVRSVPGRNAAPLLVVDAPNLYREAFVRVLRAEFPDHPVAAVSSLAALQAYAAGDCVPALVLIRDPGSDEELSRQQEKLAQIGDFPSILLARAWRSHYRDLAQRGSVKGVIPESMDVQFALSLVRDVLAVGAAFPAPVRFAGASHARLTGRQLAVVKVLRKGGTNSDIAAELGLSTSTVKVHIRNIMRRLGVKTRTGIVHSVEAR